MTTTNDGGPAFPFPSGPEPRVNQFHDRHEGMSLRDYFAAKALAAYIAHSELTDPDTGTFIGTDTPTIAQFAAIAYLQADAMLAARAENGGAS